MLAPGRSTPGTGNLDRGESWPQIPRGKKKAKGQAWSVRVMDTERGDQARQEWGQRDTGRKAGESLGGREGGRAHPPTKCRLRVIPAWLREDGNLPEMFNTE